MNHTNTTGTDGKSFTLFDHIGVALLFGAVWGFFEVFFKDVLKMGGTPFAAAIMTGIGMTIMAMGYGLFKKAGMFFAIAACTVFARMIIVPVLGCSPLCRANSVVALTLLGASTAIAFRISEGLTNRTLTTGGLTAGAGVLFSGASFYFAGLACAPCRYLQNFAANGGLASFMSAEVIYWALFSAVLFYPGYLAGAAVRDAMDSIRRSRPVPYYAGLISASVIVMLVTGLILLP